MTRRRPAVVRPLDATRDRSKLATFACRDFAKPWTDVIQGMIRDDLAASVELGHVTAIGACEGPLLYGVAAYSIDASASVCKNHVLAVQIGYRRRGFGNVLKRAVIDAGRTGGCRAVLSVVHFDNEAMINLNVRLGATVEAIPDDPDHVYCVISLVT